MLSLSRSRLHYRDDRIFFNIHFKQVKSIESFVERSNEHDF